MAQCQSSDVLLYIRKRANIGWRADGLGDRYHLEKTYPRNIAKISDYWKTAPVSFESYWWMTEWQRQGWDVDEIIEKTLEWHISSFNPKSIPIPYEWEEKVKYWLSKMGYHYAINSFSYPEFAVAGYKTEFNLNIENIGVAPSYHKIPLFLKLKGEKEYIFETDIDIRNWMPVKYKEEIVIDIPKNIEKGIYIIEISIYDDIVKNVYFATDAEYQDGWYILGEIDIQA